MCEIYEERWNRTEKYENIQLRMKDIEEALKSGEEIAAGFIEDVEQIVQAMEEEAETKSA